MGDEGLVPSGMIGVGNMGGRMARCVRDAGRPIVAYDRNGEQLEHSGIPGLPSIAELVAQTEVVFLSLPDSTVVEAVVLGDDGILANGRPGQIVVDLSTSSPESTRRLHGMLAERDIVLIDAGISGGAAAAEKGTLTLMVGGDEPALERVRPVLECFAQRIYHLGATGAGHVAKVLNNFLNGVSLAATAEVMVAAKQSGLDLGEFLDVLNHSSGVNFATLNRFPSVVKGDYLEGGLSGRLMAKDVRLYVDLMARVGVPTLNGPACLATFEIANGLGYADEISNRVVDAIGDLAGGVRLHDPEVAV